MKIKKVLQLFPHKIQKKKTKFRLLKFLLKNSKIPPKNTKTTQKILLKTIGVQLL
jgi:hypothetical protein